MKKFMTDHSFADPDAAARKIVEIANDVEAVQNGRIYIERVNAPFLEVYFRLRRARLGTQINLPTVNAPEALLYDQRRHHSQPVAHRPLTCFAYRVLVV